MPKRRSTRVPKVQKTLSTTRLEKTLAKRTRAELVEALLEIARGDRGAMRQLESRFGVDPAPRELVAATRQAIADATDFDERDLNRNFDYDYGAYETAKRNFGRLIQLGHLRETMDLSLELMERGSYQVEMSDEGLMTDDVQECLRVVFDALQGCKLPAADVIAWCTEMTRRDRVQFICRSELASLREQFEGSKSR